MSSYLRPLRFAVLGLIAAVSLKAAPAMADVLLEPYVGYKMGNFDNNGVKADLSGTVVGARLGVAFPVIFIAADYSVLTNGELDWDDANRGKTNLTGSQLFADVGVSLPLVRAYAGYGLINELKPDGSETIKKGDLWKLGVGTTIFPFIAINLEYQNAKHDKQGNNELSGVTSDAFMLSVSLPLEF